MGTPVHTHTVCSDCGLPWDDHKTERPPQDAGSLIFQDTWAPPSECIRLLKAKLAIAQFPRTTKGEQ